MAFTQGHPLIIGVGRYQNITCADVPVAVSDAQAVAAGKGGIYIGGNVSGDVPGRRKAESDP